MEKDFVKKGVHCTVFHLMRHIEIIPALCLLLIKLQEQNFVHGFWGMGTEKHLFILFCAEFPDTKKFAHWLWGSRLFFII